MLESWKSCAFYTFIWNGNDENKVTAEKMFENKIFINKINSLIFCMKNLFQEIFFRRNLNFIIASFK